MAFAVTVSAQQANTLDALRQACEKQQQTFLAQYGTALDAINDVLRTKGDLEGILVLEVEKQRLKVQKIVLNPREAPALFRPATELYFRSMVTLLGQHTKALDGLIKREVMAGRITEAKAVKMEKDKAASQLADIQTKLPAPSGNHAASKGSSEERVGAVKIKPLLPAGLLKECVLYYSFDKDGGKEVTDLSGTGHEGMLKDAVVVSDTRGLGNAACEFSVGTSIDSKPDNISGSVYRELTLAVWLKCADLSGQRHLVGRTDGQTTYQTPGSFGLELGLFGNLIPCVHFNDGKDHRLSFGKKIETDKWCHLTAVIKGVGTRNGTAAGYIDGERIFLRSGFSKTPHLPNAFFRIGQWENGGYSMHFKGLIDDVMIYRRALSDSEVKQLYNAQKSK